MKSSGRIGARSVGQSLAPLAASFVVLFYVVLLLTLTFLGQRQLRQHVSEQQRYDIEKTASSLGYFFDERRRDIERLREDRALDVFFSNQALGMSMEYGLRASLRGLEKALLNVVEKTHINGWPVFNRLVLLDNEGAPLVDSEPQEPPVNLRLSATDIATKTVGIVVDQDENELTVALEARYEHKGRPAGYIVALIDYETAFQELLRHEDEASDRTLTVVDSKGRMLIGSRQLASAAPVALSGGLVGPAASQGLASLRAPVPGAPFEVLGDYRTTWVSGYLTSYWLTASLGLLALLVLAASAMAQRTRTSNLLLEARINEAQRHEEKLSEKNSRLEEEMRVRLEYEKQLVRQANYDQLTGLPNRALANDRLEQAISRGQRTGSQIAVLYLDLDRFKNVNDTLGHTAGDELLLEAAKRLAEVARANDTVARLGGDEFLIVMADIEPGSSAEKAAERVAETVLHNFGEPFAIGGQEFFISISIGIAVFPDDGQRPERLLQHADTALYQAKEEGRHAFRFFTPDMNRRAQHRAKLEGHLIHAIERDELRLVYQPIVSLRTGRPLGVEALLRWENPHLGAVSPAAFIPLAEETGLIQNIGEWVLDRAICDFASWGMEESLRLAINVSSRQLKNPQRFLRAVDGALVRHGVQPARLELEITERLLLEELPDTVRALRELDAAGIRLSIDDFGTGYSSLGYLKRFPVDVLKIDRSFVNDVLTDAEDAALVKAILALADALRLEVVAEGVESQAQAEFLRSNGCNCGQGYWFSVPLHPDRVPAFLEQCAPTQRVRSV